MSKAVYQLEPLTCPSCIKKIETTLNKTEGSESAKVMFNSSKVKTEFDESKIKAEKIQETIQKLGYPVLSSKLA
jgi:copper chaperone CopZ